MPPKAKKLKTEDLDLDLKAENLTLDSPKASSVTKLKDSSTILTNDSKSKNQSSFTNFIKSDKGASKVKKLKTEDSDSELKAEKLTLDSPKTSRAQSPATKPKASSSQANDSKSKIQSSLTKFISSDTEQPIMNTLKLIDSIAQKRSSLFKNVLDYKFNKKRVRVLTPVDDISETSNGVLYWMTREQRVQDNWSLLYAQRLAMKQNLPLYVCFSLVPKFLDATIRHFHFMLEGLREVEKELDNLDIQFFLLNGFAKDTIPKFIEKNNIGALIVDFSPLRIGTQWLGDVRRNINVPVVQVDAHNIVPCWIASDKLEYAARTIRNKINSKLDEFLTEFPPVITHPLKSKLNKKPIDWDACYESLEVNMDVKKVDWALPGYTGGINNLEMFINKKIRFFESDRNDPTKNGLSNMSPWYHFGQVSVQRCILEIKAYKSKYTKAVESYMEEAIVRRELADNFCYYQKDYDNLNGAYDWAKITLNAHKKDKREHIYTKEEFESAKTHDRLWNAAQIQGIKEGKIHGFLRMYWAKKILEWTESPEQALEFAIYLNDKYNLDGRDPSGYVGVMWSICGIHDQGWAERAIFGKIRYMNYEGCKRKFDVNGFISRYSKI